MVKRLPTMWETRVQSLGQEELLEKEMAPHSSILAWKIPWTEEPGRLQSMRSQRVRHDWATSLQNKTKPVLLKSLKGGTVLRKWLLIHSEYVLKICQRSSSSLTHWTAKKFPKHFYYEPKCLLGFSSVAQSCPTLCDLMDCSLPGSSVHGIFQARVLEWVAISFSKVGLRKHYYEQS